MPVFTGGFAIKLMWSRCANGGIECNVSIVALCGTRPNIPATLAVSQRSTSSTGCFTGEAI